MKALFFWGTKSRREECEELNFFHSRSLFFFSPDELVRWWWWVQIHPSHRRRRGLPSSAKLSARVSEECKTTSAYKKKVYDGEKKLVVVKYTQSQLQFVESVTCTLLRLYEKYMYIWKIRKKKLWKCCVLCEERAESEDERSKFCVNSRKKTIAAECNINATAEDFLSHVATTSSVISEKCLNSYVNFFAYFFSCNTLNHPNNRIYTRCFTIITFGH